MAKDGTGNYLLGNNKIILPKVNGILTENKFEV